MENAATVGANFRNALVELGRTLTGVISEVRGQGLMVGIDLVKPDAKDVNRSLFDQGIIANATGDHTLRFVPPLVVTDADCNRVVAALKAALSA